MDGITLEELKVIIDAQTKPFRDEITKIRQEANRMTSTVTQQTGKIQNAFSSMKKFIASLAIGATIAKIGTSAINTARQVESSTRQINRLMGESAQAFMRWGEQNAQAFNMSQADFLQYGSIYSNLLTSFINSTSGVANYTTELLKASSIIASGTGRTMEDVMERIRSGLLGNTEAIEDLGVNVNVAMLESTEAFKKFAGNQSWNQLDFQTQQQIRMFAILEQTTQKFGDSVLQNTNSSLAQFTAILKDITLNIGNGLLPILNAVLPVLINIANAVKTATSYFATFMSLLFGQNVNTTAGSEMQTIADAAGSAAQSSNALNESLDQTASSARKAANAMGGLLGLDELNVISSSSQSDSSSGTSGAGSGSGIDYDFGTDLFAEEPDVSGIQSAVNKIKMIVSDFKNFMQQNAPVITSLLAGVLAGLLAFNVVKNWGMITSFVGSFSSLIGWLTNFGLAVKNFGLMKTVLTGIGSALGGIAWPAMAAVTAIAAITAALVYLYQTSETFREAVNEAVSSLVDILSNFYNSVLLPVFTLLSDLFNTIIVPLATFLAEVVVTAVDAVASVVLSIWNNVLAPIANFLVDVLGIALQGVIDIWEAWKPSIEMIFEALNWIWDTALKPIIEWLKETFIATFEQWGEVINELIPAVEGMFQGLVDFFVGVFTLDIDQAWQGITGIFQSFDQFLTGIFSTDWTNCFGSFGEVLNGFFSTVSTIWEGIKQVFNGVVTFINGVFSGNWSQAWQGIVQIFSGIFNTISGVVKGPVNTVISIVNGAIDRINGFGFDVPDWVPFIGGKSFRVNVPKLRYLAQGGIADKATLGVFGEAGEEAIIPLERNTGGIQKIAQKLGQYMEYGGNDEIAEMLMTIINMLEEMEFDPTIEADGETIAKVVNKANRRMERRKGYAY